MQGMQDTSGSILTLAVLGALVFMFAVYAGYWYLAQHMAWWTFALTASGGGIGYQLIKSTFKTIRG